MALTKISGSVIKDSVSLSGNVSVGGTLTYEDVTNVDALGIGTFRTGIKVLAGGIDVTGNIDANGDLDVDGHTNLDNVSIAGVTTFASNIYLGDNDRIYLGADDDMILWNDGSNGLLYNNTGIFSFVVLAV